MTSPGEQISQAEGQTRARYFTVRDSIGMSLFSRDPWKDPGFSPDHRYFTAVTRRGLLKTNELESTIWVFDVAAVKSALAGSASAIPPEPIALVRLAAGTNQDPITQVRWSTDSRSIAFLGRNQDSERHLFVAEVESKQLKQLTPQGQDVTDFDWLGDSFLYTARPTSGSDEQLYQSGGTSLPDIEAGSGPSLIGYLYPQWEKTYFAAWQPTQLWHGRGGATVPVVDAGTSTPISLIATKVLSLSPSSRFAVVTTYVEHVPPTWEAYEVAFKSVTTEFVADAPGTKPAVTPWRPQQYSLVDLERGTTSPLIDAPIGASYADTLKVVWSRDEKTLVLTNTYVPLTEIAPNGAHLTRPCVAVVERETRKATCVKQTQSGGLDTVKRPILIDVGWTPSGRELVLRYTLYDGSGLQWHYYDGASSSEVFRLDHGQWRAVAATAEITTGITAQSSISLAIQQSLNEPPVLTARDAATGKSRVIWNPNPQLAGLRLGEATILRWKDDAGHDWTGGLIKPPDYVPGRRYPLVIQTHGFDPHEFLTDGIFTTAYAARPLAARGIVVLQVGEIMDNLGTAQEVKTDGLPGYRAAIDQLAAEGLIDSKNVGIIGFSHTGLYVLDSLIRAPQYFRAATLAECSYNSFGQYIVFADYLGPEFAKLVEDSIGSAPFGKGLAKWIEESPGFNTDKIQAPVLFQANSPPGLINAWDMYAALRLQGKPADMLYMRNGDHILSKPLERLASQEIDVDWYDFWLSGHEDPDPAKQAQYVRWRELKKMQEENDAKARAEKK